MASAVDPWEDEQVGASSAVVSSSGLAASKASKTSKPEVVRDDWEAEEEEDQTDPRSVELQNKKIWEDANFKDYRPMPAVVMSRGSSAAASLPTLPLNQPPAVRILKRPSGSPSQSSTNVNAPIGETLKDREARYQAARDRIFGASVSKEPGQEDGKKDIQTSKKIPSPTGSSSTLNPTQRVIRDPRGPGSSNNELKANGTVPKGFGARKGHRPNGSSVSSEGPSQAFSETG